MWERLYVQDARINHMDMRERPAANALSLVRGWSLSDILSSATLVHPCTQIRSYGRDSWLRLLAHGNLATADCQARFSCGNRELVRFEAQPRGPSG